MPSKYYHYTRGPCDFFMIDTNFDVLNESSIQKQLHEVTKMIQQSKNPWKILCGHHTFRSVGGHGNADKRFEQFMEDLFPGMKKKDLSIAQAKVVHKNVLRKKGRVMKRAKFRFLPALRDKEAQKFSTKESMDMLDQAFLKAKPIDKEIDETAKRDYKAEYKKFQSSTKAKKYRAELNKYNRDKGTYAVSYTHLTLPTN